MKQVIRLTKAKVIKTINYKKMLWHCWTGCSTVMYKHDVSNKIFGPVISNCDDYALFLQVLRHTKNGMGYSECLTKYRIRSQSLSRNKLKKIKPFFDMMMNVEHKNIFLACFYLFTNQIIKLFWKYEKIR
jgi:teichuronic acid biosynthesis glycosyltransferase TuaG